MKVKAMFKKAIITVSAIAVLAAGTIASAYAATYNLGTVSNFALTATGSNSFTSYNPNAGTVTDQTGSYVNVFNNNSYSQGYAYIYSGNRVYGQVDYYIQKNYPAPHSITYSGKIPSGNNYHYWKNTGGGGFSTNLQVYLYT